MAKANGKAKSGADPFAGMAGAPGEAFKKGFERMMSFGGDFSEVNQRNMQAFADSAQAMTKGIEAMNSKAFSYMKQSMEQGMEASRALAGVKSIGEFSELQADYAKSAFQSYVEQMNQMAELFASTMRDTVEPINAQAGEMVEKLQTSS
ncbi:MAG: phasin family protein [Pseudomonadota bacterium]